jgi:hypothetical protein
MMPGGDLRGEVRSNVQQGEGRALYRKAWFVSWQNIQRTRKEE